MNSVIALTRKKHGDKARRLGPTVCRAAIKRVTELKGYVQPRFHPVSQRITLQPAHRLRWRMKRAAEAARASCSDGDHTSIGASAAVRHARVAALDAAMKSPRHCRMWPGLSFQKQGNPPIQADCSAGVNKKGGRSRPLPFLIAASI
jgi:hypothetical protein